MSPDTNDEVENWGRHLLDLWFVNREGLLGDVMVREYPGQSDHARIVFNSWGSK